MATTGRSATTATGLSSRAYGRRSLSTTVATRTATNTGSALFRPSNSRRIVSQGSPLGGKLYWPIGTVKLMSKGLKAI